MKTSVNINPVAGIDKIGKLAHVFRTHNLKYKRITTESERGVKGAVVLQPYKPLNLSYGPVGTSKITTKLSVYRKRYSKALEDKKDKIADNNLFRIKKLEFELSQTQKARRGFEAELVEISWSITKFSPMEALQYDKNIIQRMWKCGRIIIREICPKISIDDIGVAGHIDQASIHFHTVFDIPITTTFTKLISKNFSEIQQRWNELIRGEFTDLDIGTITPSMNSYTSLPIYKQSCSMQSVQEKQIENLQKHIDGSENKLQEISKINETLNKDITKEKEKQKNINLLMTQFARQCGIILKDESVVYKADVLIPHIMKAMEKKDTSMRLMYENEQNNNKIVLELDRLKHKIKKMSKELELENKKNEQLQINVKELNEKNEYLFAEKEYYEEQNGFLLAELGEIDGLLLAGATSQQIHESRVNNFGDESEIYLRKKEKTMLEFINTSKNDDIERLFGNNNELMDDEDSGISNPHKSKV